VSTYSTLCAPLPPAPLARQLWNMLNDPSASQYVHWNPEGNGFVVSDVASFEAICLPHW
jgi:hypothetical protein